MNIAKKYLQKQLANAEFKRSYLEEKVKLDIEYQLEELKKDIKTRKTAKELIKKVDSIEQYVMSA
jgi:polyhydroxyalkanoate synthesis regulator phasin